MPALRARRRGEVRKRHPVRVGDAEVTARGAVYGPGRQEAAFRQLALGRSAALLARLYCIMIMCPLIVQTVWIFGTLASNTV